MSPVDALLAEKIRAYPCLFRNRTQALHQALIVLGNGMEWRGGLLVHRAPDDRTCAEAHLRRRATPEEVELYTSLGVELPSERLTGTCPAEALRPRAEELAAAPGDLNGDPYPPSPSLPIFEMPEDADFHWLAAAREIAAVVGPLWVTPSAAELAYENDYTSAQRKAALKLLSARFDRP
ncbi:MULTISPECIES: hypothetical protein [unclassified Streptomyces]|uniref:hypothetical protein n=1 Tax=unclassified Streptomyces TaxID=2593676 RepID=UPI002258F5DB|nr:hypothetical protein [Streptomyces sp. NBC_01264]MCX4783897.1 hypothetical protein [Streptomyces sp. NBC_01264]